MDRHSQIALWRAGSWAQLDVGHLAHRLGLLGALLGGLCLRLPLLHAFPFREDEAIYSYWALHLWRIDPLALSVWPDKPPLYLWLLGGVFRLLAPEQIDLARPDVLEACARLLNIFASTLTIAVTASIGGRIWGKRAALTTAIALSLSPFAISFAPTAFTDPLLVLWGMLALRAAVGRDFTWAGLWLAAAVMTKQQGLLYSPLVVAAAGIAALTAARNERLWRSALRLGLGFLVIALPVLLWDSLRWRVAPSPWDLSVRTYGSFGLAHLDTWLLRARAWSELLLFLGGDRIGSLVLTILACGTLVKALRPRRDLERDPVKCMLAPTLLLIGWIGGFLLFHIATTTQIWDRYLLPVAPPLAVLLGGASGSWSVRRLKASAVLVPLVLLATLLPPALAAARGELPIGSDHGAYVGLHEAAAWMQANAPANSVLYHRTLGWHHRFYFFDAESEDGNRFDLRWYPHEVYLADNAARSPAMSRFVLVPSWQPLRRELPDLAVRQVALVARYRAGSFAIYELQTPPPSYCDWCACAPGAVSAGSAPLEAWPSAPEIGARPVHMTEAGL